MALVDLSDTSKKVIVVFALIAVIGLKILGVFKSKLPVYLILALAGISVITDASPVADGTLNGKAVVHT